MSERLVMGVDVRGNTRDLVSSLAAGTGAVRAFRNEVRRANNDSRSQRIHSRDLTRALMQQSMAVRSLTGDYVALRRTLLTLGIRTAITGMAALTSGIAAFGTTVVSVGGSLAAFGGALGILGGASMAAAIQGFSVFKVAIDGVGKALTTTGESHTKAMAKLTKPAREFVKSAESLRDFFRDTRTMAQNEMFPGLTRGLNHAKKISDELRQGIVDTSRVIGYLGERAGKTLASNQGQVNRLLQRNVITLRRLGDAGINFGEGLLHAFVAAEPLIGHMTAGLVTASQKFEDFTATHTSEMKFFFRVLRDQYDHWTSIIGDSARTIFSVFRAGRPEIEKVTTGIDKAAEKMRKWAESERGQSGIRHWFKTMTPVANEWAKTTGAALASFGRLSLAGAENSKALARGIRTELIPLLEDIFMSLNERLFPALGNLAGSFVDLIQAARPALKTISSLTAVAVDGFAGFIDVMNQILGTFEKLGTVGEIIGGFAVGTVILGTWRALREEMRLTGLMLRQSLGFVPRGTVTGADFRNAMPLAGMRERRQFSGRMPNDNAPPGFIFTRGGGGGGASGNGASGSGAARTVQRSPFYTDYKTARPVFRQPSFMGVGQVTVGGRPGAERDRYTGRFVPRMRGGKFLGPNGSVNAKGQFVTEPIIRTAPRYQAYQSQLESLNRPMRQRGRVGRVAGIAADFTADATRSTARGIAAGARASKPILGAVFATSAISGIIGGISSSSKTIGGKLQDAFSAATFGAVPTTGQQGAQRAGRLGKLFSGGPSFSAKDLSSTVDFSRMRGDQGMLNTLFGKGRLGANPNRKINLADPNQLSALKKMIGHLREVGSVSDEDATKLNKMLDGMKSRIDKIGGGLSGSKLKEALGANLDFGGVSSRVVGEMQAIKDGFDALGKAKGPRQLRREVETNMTLIKGSLGRHSEAGKNALAKNFRLAAKAVRQQMADGTVSTEKGAKLIQHYLVSALHELGIKHNALKYLKGFDPLSGKKLSGEAASSGVQGQARGGLTRVPGRVGPDSVPMKVAGKDIVVAPGEDVAVINRHQRAVLDERLGDMGGLSGLFRYINTPHHRSFAKGGLVTGDTDYSPGMGAALNRMARAEHQSIFVKSGGRELSEQVDLYRRYLAGTGNLAAKPTPWAPHVQGIAADIAPGRERFGGVAGKFGMGFTVPSESWHIQLLKGAAAAGIDLPSLAVAVGGLGGGTGIIVNAGLSKVASAAEAGLAQVVSELSGTTGDNPSNFKGKWTEVLAQIAQRKNWNASDWRWLVNHESTGRPGVSNATGSGAFGLGQLKPENYNRLGGGPGSSAVEQITAMAAYIDERYGDPTHARRFWEANGYYGPGGDVPLPNRGTPAAPVKPSDGVPLKDQPGRDDKGKKKKKAKKKKTIVYPAGKAPQKTPFGTGLLKKNRPRTAKELKAKAKRIKNAVAKAKKKVGGKFKLPDPLLMVDPLTGEDLSVNASAMVSPIEGARTRISGYERDWDPMVAAHSLPPDEEFIVNDGNRDLLNSFGLTVDGRFVPGISQFVTEKDQEIGLRGKVLGDYGNIESLTEQIIGGNPEAAIKARRNRLVKIRELFRINRDVRKTSLKKLNNMRKKSYNWKNAVADNNDLIRAWSQYKRSGSALPESYRENIDNIVERIRGTNEDLRRRKPKTGDQGLERKYADEAQVAGAVNNYLVGDAEKTSWLPISGGRAGAVLASIGTWEAVKSYRDEARTEGRDGAAAEKINIAALVAERDAAAGTKLPTATGGGVSDADRAAAAEAEAEEARRALAAFRLQNQVFGGMTGLLNARMVGAFAHGAVRVPQTGLALVHKNERILPDPDGPFRNGMNSPGGMTVNPSIEVILHGEGLEALTRHIEVVVDGRAQQLSRITGKRQATLSGAPGRVSR